MKKLSKTGTNFSSFVQFSSARLLQIAACKIFLFVQKISVEQGQAQLGRQALHRFGRRFFLLTFSLVAIIFGSAVAFYRAGSASFFFLL